MESRLERHVAILGGSAGIGLATARLAAERGAKITLGGRDQGRLAAAAAAVSCASAIAVDAEDPASLAGFFRATGPVDDLVITMTRRVNAVSPGVIVTGWWDSLGDHRDEAFQGFAECTPVGRNGRPEDFAAANLAPIENQFITGVVLPVDGGLRLA